MSRKNINFEDRKIKKSDFYKNKKSNQDDIDVKKMLVSKEEPYVQKINQSTLLDTMVMMLLDHYA